MLFLGGGDLRNPLLTAIGCDEYSRDLQIHVNDSNLTIIARNILLLKIICSQNFDPNNEGDINYIFNIWYNATWPDSTLKRFVEDTKSLLNDPLPEGITIPQTAHQEELREIWSLWLTKVGTTSVTDFLCDR